MIQSKTWKILTLVLLIIAIVLIYLFCGNMKEFENRIPSVKKHSSLIMVMIGEISATGKL